MVASEGQLEISRIAFGPSVSMAARAIALEDPFMIDAINHPHLYIMSTVEGMARHFEEAGYPDFDPSLDYVGNLSQAFMQSLLFGWGAASQGVMEIDFSLDLDEQGIPVAVEPSFERAGSLSLGFTMGSLASPRGDIVWPHTEGSYFVLTQESGMNSLNSL